ncbi:mucosa-associated lymphoid tissue lymphoma translocation protein 1-like [Oratosquilla oratoria]|uniref:mucosa-associated lymphoid tissue lymphoma translocation protein 1-like n=1 Tax=Oratosquilla oratoria TaxID=337810 RepID=UPI003F7618C4
MVMAEGPMRDPDAFLDDVDGYILTTVEEMLDEDDNWRKVASACVGHNGLRIYSGHDVTLFSRSHSPSAALLKDFVKRNITLGGLQQLLEDCQLHSILVLIKKPEPLGEIHQSSEGLVSVHHLDVAKVELNVAGFPPPQYQWYFQETPLLDEKAATLEIKDFSAKNEGIYLCMVQRLDQEGNMLEEPIWSKPVIFRMQQSAPQFVVQPYPEKEVINVGDQLIISCETKGHPEITYTWYLNNEKVPNVKTSQYVVLHAEICNAGCYRCVASNEEGQVESAKVFVQVVPNENAPDHPEITQQPECPACESFAIDQGILLKCEVRCIHKITFTWMVNNRRVTDGQGPTHDVTSGSTEKGSHWSYLQCRITQEDSALQKVVIVCLIESTKGDTAISRPVVIPIRAGNISKNRQYKARNKWALLIGNSKYAQMKMKDLIVPTKDIVVLAQELKKLHYRCLVVANLKKMEFIGVVKLFCQFIQDHDYVVFYYGGHGISQQDEFMVPVDASSAEEDQCISLSFIQQMILERNPDLCYITPDMCRHFVDDPGRSLARSVPPAKARRNLLILYATSFSLSALEQPRQNSILVKHLIRHIAKEIPLTEMVRMVMEGIKHEPKRVHDWQVPEILTNMSDMRSLADPCLELHEDAPLISSWNKLLAIRPLPRFQKRLWNSDVVIELHTSLADRKILANALELGIAVTYYGQSLKHFYEFSVPSSDIEQYGTHIYRINNLQALQKPLLICIIFVNPSDPQLQESFMFDLGFPSISKEKLWINDL